MNLKRTAAIAGLLLTAIFSFQNCSPVSYKDSPSELKVTDNSDSGQHYDGKIYVVLGPLCPDQSSVHSQIVLKSATSAQLVRQDCQNITPVTLTSSEFHLDPSNADQLIYQNQTFTVATPIAAGISNFLATSNGTDLSFSFTYSGSPRYLHVFLDVDNNSKTGYSVSGIGADYLLENLYLYKFSGATNTTWGWTEAGPSNVVGVAPNVGFRVSISSLGSPTLVQALADTDMLDRSAVQTVVP